MNQSHETDINKLNNAINMIENAARAICITYTSTGSEASSYHSVPKGTLVSYNPGYFSIGIMQALHSLGRFRIVYTDHNRAIGYWPENDPQNKQPTQTT